MITLTRTRTMAHVRRADGRDSDGLALLQAVYAHTAREAIRVCALPFEAARGVHPRGHSLVGLCMCVMLVFILFSIYDNAIICLRYIYLIRILFISTK